jgi:hypothetical protein
MMNREAHVQGGTAFTLNRRQIIAISFTSSNARAIFFARRLANPVYCSNS